ncbi:hypothetical protein B0F90DRAFT_32175 [Multifurca ochricompacta]|uniref:Uncharacterized protein n=1 Tax=Multifurca ochricompacta TaxID=376703 RepID=A0AAD4MCM6_9AGAM|nr:hypothetical protein B0F90DRAFT_32175 [Multifurca ochricompacta]
MRYYHAGHINVSEPVTKTAKHPFKITPSIDVLPAPLAPNLYPHVAGDGPYGQEALVSNGMYRDSWRSSLADKWIVVGRHGGPEPKFLKRQRSHDTIERQARQTRRDVSPRPLPQQRSSSNPPSLSRRLPRVPPEHGTLPRQGAHAPSAPLGVSVNPPSSFPNSPSRRVRT